MRRHIQMAFVPNWWKVNEFNSKVNDKKTKRNSTI
jgi:hypothetical protein